MFPNLPNFRDLEGLPARGGVIGPRRLYRSDTLAHLTASEAATLTDAYGLATVVDLRAEDEVARYGRGPLGAATAVRYVPVPLGDITDITDRSSFYLGVLAQRGPEVAAAVRTLAAPDALPALVHCAAGCDRTGVFVAIVLDLVGVADEVICADYALTAAAVDAINERLRRNALAEGEAWPPDWPDGLDWHPAAPMMARALTRIRDRWGDGRGWARANGLTDADIAALRAALVIEG
ncbi:tyrosine-protein phosphatase [Asanoa siamensis]|uniref:Phosphotyrosine protein phosphatase n=1 Tax=Asanoa siamensis TaxID=926357 RepID=A0ABQ4CZ57_9ACTN|nr:tyrosine-protein phosphatase [Asanoa siamensis]GIF76570.1 putative phosphotyrosine protein phosphatase [Asanoa siamensis]